MSSYSLSTIILSADRRGYFCRTSSSLSASPDSIASLTSCLIFSRGKSLYLSTPDVIPPNRAPPNAPCAEAYAVLPKSISLITPDRSTSTFSWVSPSSACCLSFSFDHRLIACCVASCDPSCKPSKPEATPVSTPYALGKRNFSVNQDQSYVTKVIWF